MTNRVRWGILSTANIGRKRVIPAIHESHSGEVVAIASRSQDKASAFAAELNIPMAYGSYEALLADPNVDAVYNPLPNGDHAEWSIRCAEAGKAVLCEKPLARDADEAQHMVDVFAERGILLAEAFMYRFHPQTQRVLALVRDGAIGTLQVIQSAFTFTVRHEGDIRLSAALAGGSLMDVGCYCVNVMRLITGEEPDDVRAVGRFGAGEDGVDESLAGVLHFPSGVIGHFDSGLRAYRTHMVDLRGTHGRILVEEAFTPAADQSTVIRYWQGEVFEALSIPPANQYTRMVDDFGDALLTGRAPLYPAQDAVANMRVIDHLRRSARG